MFSVLPFRRHPGHTSHPLYPSPSPSAPVESGEVETEGWGVEASRGRVRRNLRPSHRGPTPQCWTGGGGTSPPRDRVPRLRRVPVSRPRYGRTETRSGRRELKPRYFPGGHPGPPRVLARGAVPEPPRCTGVRVGLPVLRGSGVSGCRPPYSLPTPTEGLGGTLRPCRLSGVVEGLVGVDPRPPMKPRGPHPQVQKKPSNLPDPLVPRPPPLPSRGRARPFAGRVPFHKRRA